MHLEEIDLLFNTPLFDQYNAASMTEGAQVPEEMEAFRHARRKRKTLGTKDSSQPER